MAKRGPKPGPEPLRRVVTVSAKVSKAEKQFLQQIARAAGIPVQRIIYDGAMQEASRLNRNHAADRG